MIILRVKDNFGNQATLDILQEAELLVDISAIESGDIGEVFGISSQEFMLPGTNKNNQFFGNMFDIGADSTVALNHTIFASVLINGGEVFSGRMYINEILTDDEGYVMYKAVVVNEFIDFKLRIEDLTLRDLDLSSLDHTLSYNNITSSWDGNLAGGNVVYPLIDYGSAPSSSLANGTVGDATFNNEDFPLTIQDFKPGVKVKAIIDAIFDQTNYSYSSSFIDSDYFDTIFTLTTPNDVRGVPQEDPSVTAFLSNFNSSPSQSIANGTINQTVIFPNEDYDNGANYNPATGEYTIPAVGDYTFNTNLELTWDSAPSILYLRRSVVKIKVNGITQISQGVLTSTDTAFSAIQFTGINLQIGDVVTVTVDNHTVFRINPGVINPLVGTNLNIGKSGTSNFTGQGEGTLYGGTVNITSVFSPDLSVKDFLTAIIQRFNLVVEPKKNERNTLIIEPFNTWRDNGVNKNWSDKVDHSVRKSIQGTMKNQAKFVSFKDAEDSDYLNQFTIDNYNKIFGEKLYEGSSDLTQGTKEISNQFFAPTPVIAIDGTNTDVIPALYEVEDTSQTKKPIAFKPRLLHFNGKKRIIDVNSYDSSGAWSHKGYWFQDESGTTHEQQYYGQFHYLELGDGLTDLFPIRNVDRDLNWNNSDQYHFISEVYSPLNYFTKRDAVYEYWAQYLNELYHPDTKTLTCNIYFTPDELADIQLNDKIFIDGHYYRINNIKSFNLTNDASVQVELIKAPIRKFNFPVRRIYNLVGPSTGITGSNGNDLGGTYTDVVLDDGSIGNDGTGIYVNVDDGLPPTGSGNQGLVGRAAGMDGYTYYTNLSASVNLNPVTPQDLTGTRRNVSLGNNRIPFDAYHVQVLGNGNVINPGARNSTIIGNKNTLEYGVDNVHVYGSNNQISGSVTDTFLVGGNNNTVLNVSQSLIFNPANNITIANTNGIIALNPTEDIDGMDADRVVIGNLLIQGNQYENYETLNINPGDTIYLTGSSDINFHHHLKWVGANGTARVYLPSASLDVNNGRQMRYTTDGALSGARTIYLTPSDGLIDGAAEKVLNTPYDGLTTQVINGDWLVIQAKA